MDPTATELAGFANFDDILAWIGMAAPLVDGLRASLGNIDT